MIEGRPLGEDASVRLPATSDDILCHLYNNIGICTTRSMLSDGSLMAAVPPVPGSTKILSDGHAEGRPNLIPFSADLPDSDSALQALVSSLAPGGTSSAASPSKEDVSKISDKLKELLGDADLPQAAARRSERGEVCAFSSG